MNPLIVLLYIFFSIFWGLTEAKGNWKLKILKASNQYDIKFYPTDIHSESNLASYIREGLNDLELSNNGMEITHTQGKDLWGELSNSSASEVCLAYTGEVFSNIFFFGLATLRQCCKSSLWWSRKWKVMLSKPWHQKLWIQVVISTANLSES